MNEFPRSISNREIDDLDHWGLRGEVTKTFEHTSDCNVDAVFKEDVIRHMFTTIARPMVRLHHRNAVQFAAQWFRFRIAAITMQDQRRHGRAMLALPRLVSCFQVKGIINQHAILQGFMQLEGGTIEKSRNRSKVADALWEHARLSFSFFRNSQALPRGPEVHDASELEQVDVDILSPGSHLIKKRLDRVCWQLCLDRVERDLWHIEETR
ncbi:hypothetical protein D3C78_969980 [compost metagenome]